MTQQNNYEPLTSVEIMLLLPDAVRPPEGWFEFARSIEKAVLEKQAKAIGGIRVCARKLYDGSITVEEFALPEKYNATLILDDPAQEQRL